MSISAELIEEVREGDSEQWKELCPSCESTEITTVVVGAEKEPADSEVVTVYHEDFMCQHCEEQWKNESDWCKIAEGKRL